MFYKLYIYIKNNLNKCILYLLVIIAVISTLITGYLYIQKADIEENWIMINAKVSKYNSNEVELVYSLSDNDESTIKIKDFNEKVNLGDEVTIYRRHSNSYDIILKDHINDLPSLGLKITLLSWGVMLVYTGFYYVKKR